ncbi:MAG: PrgI family protein [Lachnospiraceae bacterium]|nr:PrgI family protein [Lachnospiraceae bacterium]
MEVEINKEILSYREVIYFGLSLRELCAVGIAIGLSVAMYFLFGSAIVCVAVSIVPILAGFYQYHGMYGGRLLLVIYRDAFRPRQLMASRSVMAEQLAYLSRYGKKKQSRRSRKKTDETPAKKGKGGSAA